MSAFPKIEYCLFDMDGLLSQYVSETMEHAYANAQYGVPFGQCKKNYLDELVERIYTDVTNVILNRHGKSLTWDIKSKVMGTPFETSSKITLASYGLTDVIPLEEYMREHNELKDIAFRKVLPMQGALELVVHLHKHGVPIAVATGSSKAMFDVKTSHLPHLFKLFPADAIVTADSAELKPGRGKPCPDVFLAAARRLGRKVGSDEEPANEEERIERSKALVFEDAVLGAQAGIRAGMNVVWVPDGELKALDPEATHGAKVVVEHLGQFKCEDWGLPAMEA